MCRSGCKVQEKVAGRDIMRVVNVDWERRGGEFLFEGLIKRASLSCKYKV